MARVGPNSKPKIVAIIIQAVSPLFRFALSAEESWLDGKFKGSDAMSDARAINITADTMINSFCNTVVCGIGKIMHLADELIVVAAERKQRRLMNFSRLSTLALSKI